MIAVANLWLFFYTPQYGLLEQLTGLFGLPSHNWLGSPSTALACVTVVAIWKESGFFMIFYLAALQQIPPVYAEAALTVESRDVPHDTIVDEIVEGLRSYVSFSPAGSAS